MSSTSNNNNKLTDFYLSLPQHFLYLTIILAHIHFYFLIFGNHYLMMHFEKYIFADTRLYYYQCQLLRLGDSQFDCHLKTYLVTKFTN